MKRRSRWDQQDRTPQETKASNSHAKKQKASAESILHNILGLHSCEAGLVKRLVKLDSDELQFAHIKSRAFKLRLLDELQLCFDEVFDFQLNADSSSVTLLASNEQLADLAERTLPIVLSKSLSKTVGASTRFG